MAVRKKEIKDAQEETPPVTPTSLQLILTPPAGYGDSHIVIDGIEYTAAKEGSSYLLKLLDTTGKTAVVYAYNDSGVPVGMYVWKLTYQGQVCTASPLPGLQDLLSYHGFSIRVQSPAGIRFKSGVDANTRKSLTGKGVDGYRLVEYGTMFITNENRRTSPFILGGTKVGGGRAYWTENGQVNDKIFETVAGRIRFTSVLVNLSPNMHATDIAFRSYMILENNGEQITVYGPSVYRSVYTVAKQIQQRGEFTPGSAGYQYVQGTIDSVEGK